MTIADKLAYLADTKDLIRQAVNMKGGALTTESTLRSYATAIENLPGEVSGVKEVPEWVASTWSGYITATNATAPAFPVGTIEAGDLLLMFVMCRGSLSSVPAGFTLVGHSPNVGDTDQRISLYSKVADGSVGSFQVTLGAYDRLCVSVSAFRGSTTPQILSDDFYLFDASGQPNYSLDMSPVTNETLLDVLTVVGVSTSLAETANGLQSQVNIPLLGWAPIHNPYGTSNSHQNRMMINARTIKAGQTVSAASPHVAMSNWDGFSVVELKLVVP